MAIMVARVVTRGKYLSKLITVIVVHAYLFLSPIFY